MQFIWPETPFTHTQTHPVPPENSLLSMDSRLKPEGITTAVLMVLLLAVGNLICCCFTLLIFPFQNHFISRSMFPITFTGLGKYVLKERLRHPIKLLYDLKCTSWSWLSQHLVGCPHLGLEILIMFEATFRAPPQKKCLRIFKGRFHTKTCHKLSPTETCTTTTHKVITQV